MPLDPQAAAVIKAREAEGAPPLSRQTAAQVRAAAHARPMTQGPAVARKYDLHVPGPGGVIPIRVYVPFGLPPFPCLVYYHGGGWVTGTLDMSDGVSQSLCTGAGCVVASVDYRLAPEHKFPAAAEDAYAAALWVQQHAGELGVDARRIAVGGSSSGGNLAAAVCLMAKDRGGRPSLVHQLLVYPVADFSSRTQSYRENGEGYMLTRDSMEWYAQQYLRTPADAANPYAAPLQAKDLGGLPQALVVTAEYDPLRDEGEAYAQKLRDAGVPVVCTRYDGMIHGFFGMFNALDKGKLAIDQACRELKKAFAG